MSIEDRLSKKLYDPRNVEGAADSTMFHAVRKFEEAFKDRPELISIIPFGSATKGYATKASDIDIQIILDSKLYFEEVKLETTGEMVTRGQRLVAEAREIERSLRAETGRDVHVHVETIDREATARKIQNLFKDSYDSAEGVGRFFRIAGKSAKEHRDMAIEEIRKLKEADQETVVREMAQALSRDDLSNKNKIEERAGETLDYVKLLETRTAMWGKRIWSLIKEGA